MTQDKTDDERLYDAQDAFAALLQTKPSKIGQRGKVLELTVEQAEQLLSYIEQHEEGLATEHDRQWEHEKDQARTLGLRDGREAGRLLKAGHPHPRIPSAASIYQFVVGAPMGDASRERAKVLASAYDQGYDLGKAGASV